MGAALYALGEDINNYINIHSIGMSAFLFSFSEDIEYAIIPEAATRVMEDEWVSLAANTTVTVVAANRILLRANLTASFTGGIGTITLSSGDGSHIPCRVEGNPLSLIYGNNAKSYNSVPVNGFMYLFRDCTFLTEVSEDFLPMTQLSLKCYYGMFQRCTNLTNAPILPAITLAPDCYQNMFYGCSSLVSAPILPAPILVLGCYTGMFYGCSSINYIEALFITEPSSQTASWLSGVSSTGTFVKRKSAAWDVSGVNGIPSGWTIIEKDLDSVYDCNYCVLLPLENGLTYTCEYDTEYSIDKGRSWSSLGYDTTSPSFNVYEQVWLRGTLDWNTSPHGSSFMGRFGASKKFELYGNGMALQYGDNATSSAASTAKCLKQLFYECTTIVYVAENFLPATTLVTESYMNMFYGCTSLVYGPNIQPTTVSTGSCSAMFSGCSSLKKASTILPAPILQPRCYSQMYRDCSSLTTAPVLPALTLVDNCYQHLFSNCSSLNYIKAMFTSPAPSYTYTNAWVNGVSSTGTFVKNKNATWDVSGWHGVPSGWTIVKE